MIRLIHKGNAKTNLKNWRPISLLCSDYKILAKILTKRLKPVLEKLVSEEQTGGIPGRKISENLKSLRNVIEFFSNERKNAKEKTVMERH